MNEGYLVRSLLHHGIVSKKLQVISVVVSIITPENQNVTPSVSL